MKHLVAGIMMCVAGVSLCAAVPEKLEVVVARWDTPFGMLHSPDGFGSEYLML